MNLKQKSVFISGSSRGLGRAIAEAYLAEGSKICLAARHIEPLEKTRNELQQCFPACDIKSIAADVSEEEGIETCAAFLQKAYGGLDILICNVGGGHGPRGIDLSLADWQQSLGQNLIGPALLIAALYPLLKKRGGNIVLISSIAGRESLPVAAPIPYSAAKQALSGMMKVVARSCAQDGMRINMVCPGNILLPGGSWERKLAEQCAVVEEYLEKEVPLKRFATGQEIATAVLFLSSDLSSFTTGATLVIDGGQTRSF